MLKLTADQRPGRQQSDKYNQYDHYLTSFLSSSALEESMAKARETAAKSRKARRSTKPKQQRQRTKERLGNVNPNVVRE
jgi:hypothetical protein